MAIQIDVDATQLTWPGLIFYVLVLGGWVGGIAVAKGFWMTLVSIFIPPVAWVVLAGHLLN